MEHQFWILLFDGNSWLSYGKYESFADAQKAKKELSEKWDRIHITLLLE